MSLRLTAEKSSRPMERLQRPRRSFIRRSPQQSESSHEHAWVCRSMVGATPSATCCSLAGFS
jgi:hypothetical protein